jgi:hypothetical protein
VGISLTADGHGAAVDSEHLPSGADHPFSASSVAKQSNSERPPNGDQPPLAFAYASEYS